MARIDIDVENVDETFAEIEKDIHDGMEKAAHELATIAKEDAKTTIRENNAVFNYEVLESWRRIEAQSTPERVTVILTNRADHAPALNYGVDPAEYADGGPPVQALIPWVERKLSGWDIDIGGGGGGGGSSAALFSYSSEGSIELPEGWMGRKLGDTSGTREEHFVGQSVKFYDASDVEVFEGVVEDLSYFESDDRTILTVNYEDGRTGVDFDSVVGYEQLSSFTESEQRGLIRQTYDVIETGDDISQSTVNEIRDYTWDGLYSRMRDTDLLNRNTSRIVEYIKSTKDDVLGAAVDGASTKQTWLKFKDNTGLTTAIHEHVHNFHYTLGFNRHSATSEKEIPDLEFDKDGLSMNHLDDAVDHLLQSRDKSDRPGKTVGFKRAVHMHVNDDSPFEFDTDVTASDYLEPGNIQLEEGDVFKVRVANGSEWTLILNSTDTEQFEHRNGFTAYEIDAKVIENTGGAAHSSQVLPVRDTGELTGDVELIGVGSTKKASTYNQVQTQIGSGSFIPDDYDFDEITNSEITTADDPLSVATRGDVVTYNQDGESKYGMIDRVEQREKDYGLTVAYGLLKPNDNDSSLSGADLVISDSDMVETGEVTGVYTPEFANDVGLQESNPERRLIEAGNIAWLDVAYQISEANAVSRSDYSSINFPTRPYSGLNASEVLTTISEMLMMPEDSEKYKYTPADIRFAYRRYPFLVRAWSENFDMPDWIERVLRSEGMDI